ncbi:hypothetical protein [Rubrivirga sp. IMCC45206]|uniref:hypothetical protein n=1 Tax=Rubrivirga sp. IMCC45206 TaxID=3391614 RepID=UPI00398FD811
MTGLDRTALVLNTLAILMWLPAFASQEEGLFLLAVGISLSALLLSTVVVATRSRQRETPAVPTPSVPVDEFDPHTVLDLDARLEALEKAQHDAVDAARWRALVESGQVTGPGAEPIAGVSGDRRNGAADRA